MKKFLLASLFVLLCISVKAQSISIEDIASGWKTKPIHNVANGSIGILMEAFDKAWPTYVTRDACMVLEKGLDSLLIDPETGYRVIVDAKSGFLEVTDDGTDGIYMSACLWSRSNGNILFAVMIGKPTDPELEVVCFYDYNPKTKTLSPEPDILTDFKRMSDGSQIHFNLPRKGKELTVIEYELPLVYAHHFVWNGMRPVFDRVDLDRDIMKSLEVSTEEYFPVSFKGNKPDISDFVSAILSRDELGEALGGMADNWKKHLKGKTLPKEVTFTVDSKNGYLRYDVTYPEAEHLYIEYCYWNCADGKHKLIGENISLIVDGRPVDTELTGLSFYWYDNATRQMCYKYAFELGDQVEPPAGSTGSVRNLPRQGKTIEFIFSIPQNAANTSNRQSRRSVTKKLTWNGTKFVNGTL